MFRENYYGAKSEIKSTVQDFLTKLKLIENNKIKEVNVMKKSQQDFFEAYILPAKDKYHDDEKALRNSKFGWPIGVQFLLLHEFDKSKSRYLWVKDKYDEADARLNSLMTKFKKSFVNSDYSYYRNVRNEKIMEIIADNGYSPDAIFRLPYN